MGLSDNWDRGRVYGTVIEPGLNAMAAGTYRLTMQGMAKNADDDNVTFGGLVASGQLSTDQATAGFGGKPRSFDIPTPLVDDTSITPTPVHFVLEIKLVSGLAYTYVVEPTAAQPSINIRDLTPSNVVKATAQTLRAGKFGTDWLQAETVDQAAALLPDGLPGGSVDLGPVEDRLGAVEATQSAQATQLEQVAPQVLTHTNQISQLSQGLSQVAGDANAAKTSAANAETIAGNATTAANAAAASAAQVGQFNDRIVSIEGQMWMIEDSDTVTTEVISPPTDSTPGRMKLNSAGGGGGTPTGTAVSLNTQDVAI